MTFSPSFLIFFFGDFLPVPTLPQTLKFLLFSPSTPVASASSCLPMVLFPLIVSPNS